MSSAMWDLAHIGEQKKKHTKTKDKQKPCSHEVYSYLRWNLNSRKTSLTSQSVVNPSYVTP